jgi:hypothetical protein
MVNNLDEHAKVRRYLLGQLTNEERGELEQRLFQDAELYEELEIAEAELCDAYAAGKIREADRPAFEELFLNNPDRKDNLRFARALRRYANADQNVTPVSPPASFWQSIKLSHTVALALILLVVIGGLWFFTKRTPPQYVALTIKPATLTRGAEDQILGIKIPPNASGLRLTLPLLEPQSSVLRYRAELVSQDGETVPAQVVSYDAENVVVQIKAGDLKPVIYDLKLFALTNDGERRVRGNYYFRIE